jgi:hypothetical protein
MTNVGGDNTESIAIAAVEASFHSQAAAIVVITTSGKLDHSICFILSFEKLMIIKINFKSKICSINFKISSSVSNHCSY